MNTDERARKLSLQLSSMRRERGELRDAVDRIGRVLDAAESAGHDAVSLGAIRRAMQAPRAPLDPVDVAKVMAHAPLGNRATHTAGGNAPR